MSQLDVLVIDDNHEQANITKLLLEHNGYKTEFFTESKTALSNIIKQKPKLIILDLMMPDLDGLRLCKMIKDNPDTADTRIIIYSGKMYESDRRKALAIGADLFLTKPTRAYVLLDAVSNLLSAVPDEIN